MLPNPPKVCMPLLRLEFPFLWKDRINGRAKRAVRNQPLPLLLSSVRGHMRGITSLQIIYSARIIVRYVYYKNIDFRYIMINLEDLNELTAVARIVRYVYGVSVVVTYQHSAHSEIGSRSYPIYPYRNISRTIRFQRILSDLPVSLL